MTTTLDPRKMASAQKRERWVERMLTAATLLTVHGFLTDTERLKVHRRMLKWVAPYRGKAT